ncbi:hypothetical protein Vadar_004501 [Vaccinium darrowii]|uniref:Uncharacterized protein n=1 Tax=Vaccinium darrowii TaxID=229202 RepID=A0ACB7Z1N9_9ERIC|nr:hypothetical protein Vadar_004501 [Vaccinium darrowii]
MGWNTLPVRRTDNQTSRQVIYSKRKDVIVKKASELSVLCDTDVGLLMFSPTGRLTSFTSNGRIEDIFLRFISRPGELKGGPILDEEYLSRRLKQLKQEGEMLEKMAKLLESTLYKLNGQQRETQEKMRYYNPNVENIESLFEAGVYQQFLENAIERVEQSKTTSFDAREHVPNTDKSANSNIQWYC